MYLLPSLPKRTQDELVSSGSKRGVRQAPTVARQKRGRVQKDLGPSACSPNSKIMQKEGRRLYNLEAVVCARLFFRRLPGIGCLFVFGRFEAMEAGVPFLVSKAKSGSILDSGIVFGNIWRTMR